MIGGFYLSSKTLGFYWVLVWGSLGFVVHTYLVIVTSGGTPPTEIRIRTTQELTTDRVLFNGYNINWKTKLQPICFLTLHNRMIMCPHSVISFTVLRPQFSQLLIYYRSF